MNINKEDGLWILNVTKNTFFYFENDWRQLFGNWNWKTYRFADIYYENDVMLGGQEFRFVILGLGFCIRRQPDDTPGMIKLNKLADEARKASDVKQKQSNKKRKVLGSESKDRNKSQAKTKPSSKKTP